MFSQVCGDPDLRTVQALQREDAEYPGAGICRGTSCPSAQTEETKHGIPFTYTINSLHYPTISVKESIVLYKYLLL